MHSIAWCLRLLLLVLILLGCHVLAAGAAGVTAGAAGVTAGAAGVSAPAEPAATASGTPVPSPEERAAAQARLFFLTLGVCALETLALAYPVARSRWGGARLVAAVFALFFGVVTVQPLVEAAYFGVVPSRLLGRLVLMGAGIAVLYAPAAVLLLRRWKVPAPAAPRDPVWRGTGLVRWLATAVVVYVVLYFLFGYYVAWQSEAVRAFYGGSASASVGQHLLGVLRESPSLLLLQALRALLWAALAVLVVAMMRRGRWEHALALGLLFAVLMNAQLLLPNSFLPEPVRRVHLLETAACNLLFGVWLGVSFPRARPAADGTHSAPQDS